MRTVVAVVLFVCLFLKTFAADDLAISRLNPDLVPLYDSLLAEGQGAELIGKPLQLRLNLKHASDRLLLFTDTQIVPDKDTRYYLIKWRFRPNNLSGLAGKRNVVCKVRGRIVEIVSGAPAPRMPYIIAELLSVEPLVLQ